MISVLKNFFYFTAGIGFLMLSKGKNLLRNYTTSREFGYSDLEKCADYDLNMVDHWMDCLHKYTNNGIVIGKNILELGPGSDLGIGLYLLSLGCKTYNAIDVNNLANSAPASLYEILFKKIKAIGSESEEGFLREQLRLALSGDASNINYVVREDFDILSAFKENSIDLVFSMAAFEHFDHFSKTAYQLWRVCKPGAVVIAGVDLKTHTRWIRDHDPNNIYRYPEKFYEKFWFRGIPNRLRPYQYKEAFERAGWEGVSITPSTIAESNKDYYSGLSRNFRHPMNQMEITSMMICARNAK